MGVEYINNKDFEKLIGDFLKRPKNEELKNEVTLCFYLLSDNIVRAFNFKLIDREDALQEGVLICLTKLEQFDPLKGKAFNWFTTIILNHFRQLYRSSKNDLALKRKYFERQILGETSSFVEGGTSDFIDNVSSRARRNIEQY